MGSLKEDTPRCPRLSKPFLVTEAMSEFSSPNGEDVLIVEFLTREAFDAWDKHPEHKKAKMLGKDYIFESYDVKVGEVFERHTKPEVKL